MKFLFYRDQPELLQV